MLKRRDLSSGCRLVQNDNRGSKRANDRRELQHMLHLNKKAEIQILSGIREDEEQSLESIYSEGGVGEVKVSRLLSYILERLV
jgi:DNA-directed RNA polymerase specialized sigma subunit